MKMFTEVLLRRWDRFLAGGAVLGLMAVAVIAVPQIRQAHVAQRLRLARLASGELSLPAHFRQSERYAMDELADVQRRIHPDTFTTERDIFGRHIALNAEPAPPQIPAPTLAFELVDIAYKPMQLQYLGRIEFSDGGLAGQINFENRTYLVRRGASFAGFLVTAIDRERVVLQRGSVLLRLGYRTVTNSEELQARVRVLPAAQVWEVVEGERLAGFTIVDISADAVTLANDERILELKKGTVRP